MAAQLFGLERDGAAAAAGPGGVARRRSRSPAIRPRCMPRAAPRGAWSNRRANRWRRWSGARRRRVLHLGRHRGQHAGADAGDRDRRRKAAARPASDVGDRACLGARRRPVSARSDRGYCRSMRDGPARSRGARRSRCANRRGRWSRSCSPTTRPAWCSRSRRLPRSCMRPAACFMSMRCRRPAESLAISARWAPIC